MHSKSPDQWPDDRILTEQLRQGDERGLEGLYRRYYGALVGFAMRFLRDQDSARDAVQEVYIRLWKNRAGLQVDSSVKSYLYRSVRNQSLNTLRDRPDWESLQEEQENLPERQEDGFGSADEDKARNRKLREAIGRLSPRTRTVFELARFEGLTYAEIAQYMNVSEKTVENQMRSALMKLREMLLLLLLFPLAGAFRAVLSLQEGVHDIWTKFF